MFYELTLRYDFQDAVGKLREKWFIYDTDKFNSFDNNVRDEFICLFENARFRYDVTQMLLGLNISSSWTDLVHEHVITDSVHPFGDTSAHVTRISEGVVLNVDVDDPKKFSLTSGGELVLKDLSDAREFLNQSGLVNTTRREDNEPDNFWRDHKIFQLADEGKALDEIYTAIKKEFDDDMSYDAIKTVVSRWYKRTKTPLSKQKKLMTHRSPKKRLGCHD
jgi:hypothetical protein